MTATPEQRVRRIQIGFTAMQAMACLLFAGLCAIHRIWVGVAMFLPFALIAAWGSWRGFAGTQPEWFLPLWLRELMESKGLPTNLWVPRD